MHPNANTAETPPTIINIRDCPSKRIERAMAAMAVTAAIHPKTAIAIEQSITDDPGPPRTLT